MNTIANVTSQLITPDTLLPTEPVASPITLSPDAPRRVLLVSASIGGGHVAAARALKEAFETYAPQVKLEHLDLLEYTAPGFRRLYRDAYFDLVRNVPDFVDWFGKRLDKTPTAHNTRARRLLARLSRLVSRKLARHIQSKQPNLIIHTHFLAPSLLTKKEKARTPEAVIITDYGAHSVWISPDIERYFVATEEISVHLQSLGVEQEQVRVSGIPIAAAFTQLETHAHARTKLSVHPNKAMLLLMASGMDPAVLIPLIKQLRQLRLPLKVYVVCGRTPELKKMVEREKRLSLEVQFEVLGFTQEIPRLMAAADLLVGKPGGLITSEALAAGLPFAVVSPYPLQEEANANFLLEGGMGMRIEPLSVFSYKVEQFFKQDAKSQAMTQAALSHARPTAARIIVESLLTDCIKPSVLSLDG